LGTQPAAHAFFLHRRRERLVEIGVIRYVQHLVRELMKNDRRQFDVVPAQHRAQDRIVEVPERRIGGHAADAYVKAPPAQLSGE